MQIFFIVYDCYMRVTLIKRKLTWLVKSCEPNAIDASHNSLSNIKFTWTHSLINIIVRVVCTDIVRFETRGKVWKLFLKWKSLLVLVIIWHGNNNEACDANVTIYKCYTITKGYQVLASPMITVTKCY